MMYISKIIMQYTFYLHSSVCWHHNKTGRRKRDCNELSLHSLRMAKIKNSDNTKCFWEYGVARSFTLLVGMDSGTANLKKSLAVSHKTKNAITIWPSNTITGHIPWENHNSKRHIYPNVHRSIIYNSQDMETMLSVHPQRDG